MKPVDLVYRLICKIYQKVSTIFENLFLKKRKSDKEFKNSAYFKYRFNNLDLKKIINYKSKFINDYLAIRDFNNEQIIELINKIFDSKFREYITKKTGFEYSIDFVIFYDRFFIPNNLREANTLKQYYSYKWHFDKPNSSNVLKIILPLNINDKKAALSILNQNSSKNISRLKPKNFRNLINFIGFTDNVYGFNPRLCWHKDGIPKKNEQVSQIMFQLNPWTRWSYNINLSESHPNINKQLKIWTNEPKFRWLTLNNDKRIPF